LIEVFRKLFNPQNDGHQGLFLGGLSFLSAYLPLEKAPGAVMVKLTCVFKNRPC
jgi:hypothetical protein